ncbi:replication factor C subunit 3-like [Papaver somniferum]|nr:replication factor C subunit 3-like [Papaver somniferum]
MFVHAAIIIHEADKLSRDAQLYIKWLMERNNQGCTKVFFCCSETSRLQHLRSISTVIQLFPPSNKEIVEVLKFIAEKECIQLQTQLAERIAENSKHNLRQAIRSFEATWHFYNEFTEDQVLLTGWEEDVANIAEKIIEEQSPRQLYIIRGKFQNLIDHNVSPDFIFTSLVGELKKRLSKEFHSKIDAFFLEYKMDIGGVLDGEKSLILLHSRYKESKGKGNIDLGKDVQHFMMIEEFTAKFMSYYKAYTNNKNLKLKEKL